MSTEQQAAEDFLLGGGIRWASFPDIGKVVEGEVVEVRTLRQSRDFTTQEPMVWSDGQPRKELPIVVQTSEHEDEDDDGRRQIVIRGGSGGLQGAFRDAMRGAKLGLSDLTGARLSVEYVGNDKPRQRGMFGAKKYEVRITPRPDRVEDLADFLDDEDEGGTST